jgi:phage terminase small subunit
MPTGQSAKTSVKNKEEKLNPKQELFCQYYASDREFFGSGVDSYLEAYNPDRSSRNWYKNAQSASSRLLSNVIICERINELLESGGLNDSFVDKQLQMLITQHDDKSAKMKAIAEYNKLKARITIKTDVTTDGEKINTIIYKPEKLSDDYDTNVT